jgi:ABC-2 type transport system permease protein
MRTLQHAVLRVASPPLRALLWLELRQLGRGRGAVLSAVFLPLLMMVGLPLYHLGGLRAAPHDALRDMGSLQALGGFTDPAGAFTGFVLPLYVALAGVLTAPGTASYSLVTDRERRALDLLAALPIRVGDILAAKVAAVLLICAAITLPLLGIDAVVLASQHLAGAAYLLQLLLLLLAALFCSTGITLVLTLVARDYRTARNLAALQTAPIAVLLTTALLVAPGAAKLLAGAALLTVLGLAASVVARRWLTFERYLG